MSLVKHLLSAVVLALAACAPSPPEHQADARRPAPTQLWSADTRTILGGDAARALAHQCSRVSPGPVDDLWTPSETEISQFEDDLILRVAREQEARGESPSPGGYYRQYAGFVIGGRRIIYVNGVDESAVERDPNPARPFDWRTQPILICDGGPITFGAEYDPATHQISNFAFNGSV